MSPAHCVLTRYSGDKFRALPRTGLSNSGMPELVRPRAGLRASFAQALAETRASSDEADRWLGLTSPAPDAVSWSDDILPDDAAFAAFVADQWRAADEDAPRPQGYVPATHLWWVDGHEWLGRLSLRHRLTPFLRDVGGHIGYFVRPSARRRGHATAMLTESLRWARDLGLEQVLVTCDADNVASRRVIETNGGRLDDQRGVKLRFWIATAQQAHLHDGAARGKA